MDISNIYICICRKYIWTRCHSLSRGNGSRRNEQRKPFVTTAPSQSGGRIFQVHATKSKSYYVFYCRHKQEDIFLTSVLVFSWLVHNLPHIYAKVLNSIHLDSESLASRLCRLFYSLCEYLISNLNLPKISPPMPFRYYQMILCLETDYCQTLGNPYNIDSNWRRRYLLVDCHWIWRLFLEKKRTRNLVF